MQNFGYIPPHVKFCLPSHVKFCLTFAKMDSCASTEDLLDLLKNDYGIDITAEELRLYLESITDQAGEDGELSKGSLEMVGGGSLCDWIRGLPWGPFFPPRHPLPKPRFPRW